MELTQAEYGMWGWEKTKHIFLQRYKERIAIYELNPKFCKHCNALIPYINKRNDFCNRSCSATFNNKKFKKRPDKPKIEKISPTQKSLNRFNTDLESGILTFSHHALKRHLVRVLPNECNICKKKKWNKKPIPLIMDHINGDSTDNSFTNLRLVCPNCDAQLPTYKAKNKGKGRAYRRERYHAGKSY